MLQDCKKKLKTHKERKDTNRDPAELDSLLDEQKDKVDDESQISIDGDTISVNSKISKVVEDEMSIEEEMKTKVIRILDRL